MHDKIHVHVAYSIWIIRTKTVLRLNANMINELKDVL